MLGNRVKVTLEGAEPFEGTLLKQDKSGVIVHKNDGFNDDRRFIPYTQIIDIQDKGPIYR